MQSFTVIKKQHQHQHTNRLIRSNVYAPLESDLFVCNKVSNKLWLAIK